MKTIELMGPPGSGKSSLIANIIDELKLVGINAMTVDEALRINLEKRNDLTTLDKIIWKSVNLSKQSNSGSIIKRLTIFNHYRAEFILKNQKILIETIKSLKSQDSERLSDSWIISVLIDRGAINELLNSFFSDEQWIIVDEGFYQLLTTLFSSCNKKVEIEKVAQCLPELPKVDFLINIQSKLETCFARCRKRGFSKRRRFTNRTDSEIKNFISNSAEIINFSNKFARESLIPSISINNNGSVKATTLQFKNSIKSLDFIKTN